MIPLEPTHYFHIYNRANGSEKVFLSPGNYHFFMKKYLLYVSPFVNTYAYCLMSNHFHFLVQIKSEAEIKALLSKDSGGESGANLQKFTTDPELFISKQWSKLCSSYTQAFNKQQHRMGSLFMKNFKRRQIKDELYLKKLVHYIHNNPVEAELCDEPANWPYSSYAAVIRGDAGFIKTKEVLDWFDDVKGFQAFHKLSPSLTDVD